MATTLDTPLNEQQLRMLPLFKDPLPEEDFEQMRRLAVKLLAQRADELISDWEEKNNITEEHYDRLSEGHFRSKGRY